MLGTAKFQVNSSDMRLSFKMKLKQLDIVLVTKIYKEHMVIDFPKEELKPLDMILKLIEENRYEAMGLYDGDLLTGYVFIVRIDNSYLLDYIAIFPEYRNDGKGSNLLSLLAEHLDDADSIIVEVENPKYTDDGALADLQTRRIGFYKRNGCRDTGLRVSCFGAKFIILEMGANSIESVDKTWELYEAFYRSFLPEDKFIGNVYRILK